MTFLIKSNTSPILLLLGIIAPLIIHAQSALPAVKLEMENAKCLVAYHDSKDSIWFGTQDGLFLFDDYNLQAFKSEEKNPQSISGNIIMDITEDHLGNLWVATLDRGLNYFNRKKAVFSTPIIDEAILLQKNLHATSSILIENENSIWVGTYNGGLHLFDIKNNIFSSFSLNAFTKEAGDQYRTNSILDIVQDKADSNLLWIAGNNGLYCFNKAKTAFEGFYQISINSNELKEKPLISIQELYMENPGTLWLGTWGRGLIKFNTQKRIFEKSFLPNPQKAQDLWNSNVVNGMGKKSDTELWISDRAKGIGIFNTTTEEYSFDELPFDSPNLEDELDQALGLQVDRKKRIWGFYNYSGIKLLNQSTKLFHPIIFSHAGCYPSQSPPITCLDKDVKNNIIYATQKGCGYLYIYNGQNNALEENTTFTEAPAYIDFKKIKVDYRGRVWVVGVNIKKNKPFITIYIPQIKQWLSYEQTPLFKKIKDPFFINAIYEDVDQNLWFGTANLGLIKLTKDQNIIQYPMPGAIGQSSNSAIPIALITEDPLKKIWLGTLGNGVYSFDPISASFKHYKYYPSQNYGLNHGYIQGITAHKNGKIWVTFGTNGIQIIDPNLPDTQTMQTFLNEQGLPDEKLRNILTDHSGNIWLMGQKGLIKYNDQNENFTLFTKTQGIKDQFLFDKEITLTKEGEILVGQNNGFLHFQPDQLCASSKKTINSITYLKVIGDKSEELQAFKMLKEVQLQHNQNYFSIGFNSNNFFQSDLIQYEWKLEGYDKNWSKPSTKVEPATYSKVPPGNYIFHLKSSDYCGNPNANPIKLAITITYPWWKRWWAYLLYFIVLGSFFLGLYYYQRKRWELENQLILERSESERLKDFAEWKTQFYTNITHEFKMPLTVIMGMADELSQQKDLKIAKLNSSVKLIRRNSKQLLFLIRQILDLSKLESKAMPLNFNQGNIVPFIKFISESCQSLSESKDIRLFFSRGTDEVIMDFDGEKIQLIIFNLLSNAIKFTNKGGIVNLHVEETIIDAKKMLAIQVKDNGIGISKEQLPFIFNRFYQADQSSTRRAEGTGIGLALIKELIELFGGSISVTSTIGEGSNFTTLLPISRNAELLASNTFHSIPSLPDFERIETEVQHSPTPTKEQEQFVILIVEDNLDVTYYLNSLLQSDFKIINAANGVAGIQKTIEHIPDIIISDVMMPEKNGFELCDTLKRDERTSHIPIILLTAKAEHQDKIQGLQYGADAFLAKPFDRKELLIRVQNLIQLRLRLQKRYNPMDYYASKSEQKSFALEDVFIKKITAIIEQNLDDEDFGVENLAQAVFLSRTQVHRKIKALTGNPTGQFIRKIRLQKAMELLQETDRSITEIAYSTGFKTLPYFSRLFTENFGKPPSHFRK